MTKVRLQCNAGPESFLIRTPTLTLFQHHVSDLTVMKSRSHVEPDGARTKGGGESSENEKVKTDLSRVPQFRSSAFE
jgi:hypothetical protein